MDLKDEATANRLLGGVAVAFSGGCSSGARRADVRDRPGRTLRRSFYAAGAVPQPSKEFWNPSIHLDRRAVPALRQNLSSFKTKGLSSQSTGSESGIRIAESPDVNRLREESPVRRARGRDAGDDRRRLRLVRAQGGQLLRRGLHGRRPTAAPSCSPPSIRSGSAARAGLKAGDRIILADGQTASSLSNPSKALSRPPLPHQVVVIADGEVKGISLGEPSVRADVRYLFLAFVGLPLPDHRPLHDRARPHGSRRDLLGPVPLLVRRLRHHARRASRHAVADRLGRPRTSTAPFCPRSCSTSSWCSRAASRPGDSSRSSTSRPPPTSPSRPRSSPRRRLRRPRRCSRARPASGSSTSRSTSPRSWPGCSS